MGEIADMMLEGTLCAGCGEYMGGSGDGFPRYCAGCGGESFSAPSLKPKAKCPTCGRKVKAIGLSSTCATHTELSRDAHRREREGSAFGNHRRA